MITRSQMKWIFISLVALRLIIGFHFFTEGKKKIEQGNWSAAPFFAAAKGPLAPMYLSLLPDYDKLDTLCVVRAKESDEADAAYVMKVDPEPTFGYWWMFVEDVLVNYKLKQSQIQQRLDSLNQQVQQVDQSIQQLEAAGENVAALLQKRSEMEDLINRLNQADPVKESLAILERRKKQLSDYVLNAGVRDEILKSVEDEKRLSGFVRDGVNKKNVAVYVESLRGQVDSIKADVRQVRSEHADVVEGIWNGLESELNAYGASLQSPVESQTNLQDKVTLQKPFEAQRDSMLYWVNKIVPYFDLTVGILLLLGLFSRLASLAAAGFLLGIISTQPLWVPGHDPKIIAQIIEFGGLLVLAATVAGRYGGLDYFLWWMFGKRPEDPASQDVDLA